MELWIPITIFAAFMQNLRSALQRSLKDTLDTSGATFTRFVYGAPETILAHAGSIARRLLARSIPLALVDWPNGAAAPFGRAMPAYGVRYKRGGDDPALGDLLDTEYALFGI